jgi:hypothetical protein
MIEGCRGKAFGKQSQRLMANLAAECFALGLPGKPAWIVFQTGWLIARGVWAKHLGDQFAVI